MPPGRKSSTGKPKAKSGCVLCKRSNEDEVDFGGLHSTKILEAHHFCLLLSESISQTGEDHQGIWGFVNSDITREVKSSQTKQCHYCKEFGATLACNRKNCKRKFHLPCGLMNRTQHDFEKFISYCHAHRKPPNIPPKLRSKIGNYLCLICLENHNPKKANLEELVWADCCRKDVILHIACVKKLALSAGYFTKCPACNNNKEFIDTIKKYGVFVPERDASWEFERNAFQDLLVRHDKCDVDKCVCPKGRDYKSSSGIWKIILCQLCGSFGSHNGCSSMNDLFVCKTCNIITPSNNETVSKSTTESVTVVPATTSRDDNIPDSEQSLNKEKSSLDEDVISISSDSDDHFSEVEPEGSPQPENVPQNSARGPNSRKRKLTDTPTVQRQVAKKKTVFSQSRSRTSEPQQVARKTTSGNQIYSRYWPRKVEESIKVEPSVSNATKCNINYNSALPEKSGNSACDIHCKDLKHIPSISDIIKSTQEMSKCVQIFCSGAIILQCPDSNAVQISNNNEVEIANVTDGIIAQRTTPLLNPKPDNDDPIEIIDSDDEVTSPFQIVNVYTESNNNEESGSNFKDKERLSPSGIFENRIRSTTEDFFKRSRSPHKFKCMKRTNRVVKIDFKPTDSISTQWNRLHMPR